MSNLKNILRYYLLIIIVFVASYTNPRPILAIEHPHVLYNQREIDDLRTRIENREEPLLSHYNSLKSHAGSAISTSNLYTGNDPKFFREGLDLDGPLMFSNAMLYALDRNQSNATRTRDLLISWTNSLTQVEDYDDFSNSSNNKEAAAMFLGRAMFQIVPAYDLIYESSALSENDKEVINTWLSKVASLIEEGMDHWFNSGSPMPCHQYSNHVSAHLTGLMLIGYILEDTTLTQDVISGSTLPTNWKEFLKNAIYMQGDPVLGCDSGQNPPTYTGEVVDRYRHLDHPGSDPNLKLNRGLGYSLLSTYNLALGAEAAYHHGVDLFHYAAPSGESLKLPGIYYMHYLKTFGPNDTLITTTGYNGENMYVNEILQKDFIKPYELLALRYENNISIANAFSKYYLPSRTNYNHDYIFGKLYRYDRLHWDFLIDNVDEGWTTPTNITKDGALQITTRDESTTLTSPPLNIRASDYPYFSIKFKATGGGNHQSTLSWGNNSSTDFTIVADGQYHEYVVDLSNHPRWSGSITELKLLPISVNNSTVVIDWIRLQKDIPTAKIPGDLDNDGHVNFYDFNLLISKFGNPYTIVDFNLIITNYGN